MIIKEIENNEFYQVLINHRLTNISKNLKYIYIKWAKYLKWYGKHTVVKEICTLEI